MSAAGGSIMALWSAKGILLKMVFVLSLSNAAQPPLEHCMESIQ